MEMFLLQRNKLQGECKNKHINFMNPEIATNFEVVKLG